MSTQIAKDFMMKAASDQVLRERIMAQSGDEKERISALVETGRHNGYVFSADDVRSVLTMERPSDVGQLDDSQLSQVAGGVKWYWAWVQWLGGGAGDGGGQGVVGVRG